MTVEPDRRLVFLVPAKLAGLGLLAGLAIGVAMAASGQGVAWLVTAPLLIAGFLAVLGGFFAALWWLGPGRVAYTVTESHLVALHGGVPRVEIPLDHVADLGWDREFELRDLIVRAFAGPEHLVPRLVAHLTESGTPDAAGNPRRSLPGILLCGDEQREALDDLRLAVAAAQARSKFGGA